MSKKVTIADKKSNEAFIKALSGWVEWKKEKEKEKQDKIENPYRDVD